MSTDVSPAVPASLAGSQERWAAWVAKGAAHDRVLRRRSLITLSILGVLAALLISFVLSGARLKVLHVSSEGPAERPFEIVVQPGRIRDQRVGRA